METIDVCLVVLQGVTDNGQHGDKYSNQKEMLPRRKAEESCQDVMN